MRNETRDGDYVTQVQSGCNSGSVQSAEADTLFCQTLSA